MNSINPLAQISSKNHLLNASAPLAPGSEKKSIDHNLSLASNFEFNADLDVPFLNYFYRGDIEQAAHLFDIFLNVTAKEFNNLADLVRQKDWIAFRQLAHKMKPNFKMVGLTKISLLLEELEYWGEDPLKKEEFFPLLNSIHSSFQKGLPLVVNERRRIGLALTKE